MSRQHPKPQSSCCSLAKLGLWASTSQWQGTLGPSQVPPPPLVFGKARFGTRFRIPDLCCLHPPNLCYQDASPPWVLPCLISIWKFWLIHFDLGNSSNRQLHFLLWISFHRLRLLQCPAPSFSLLSLGSIADCEQENEFLSIMFKLYVDKGNYLNWNRLSTGTLCRTICTSWAGCPCLSDTSAEECWHSQGCVVVVQRLLQTPSRAG